MDLRAAFRAQASGLWSTVKSSVPRQSEHHGCSFLARLLSRAQVASYPREWALPFVSGSRHSGQREPVQGEPQSRQGFIGRSPR